MSLIWLCLQTIHIFSLQWLVSQWFQFSVFGFRLKDKKAVSIQRSAVRKKEKLFIGRAASAGYGGLDSVSRRRIASDI